MSYLQKLSIEISSNNIDMTAVSHGTLVGGMIPISLSVLAQVNSPQHYKDLFVHKALSVPKAPDLPTPKTEKLVFEDNFGKYMDKVLHQKNRGYFLIKKDLELDELLMLNRMAIYSILENTKKTEKYYTDLLECSRMKFKDRYSNTLELFCFEIDNRLHDIEKQAREFI